MTVSSPTPPAPPTERARAAHDPMGRVIGVSGAQITIGLNATTPTPAARATVGKYLGIVSGSCVTVGLITEIAERPAHDQDPACRSTARIDLVGQIKADSIGTAYFQRGIAEY